MFHEYREEISQLKSQNAHFERIFDEHNELDQKIMNAENGLNPMNDLEIDKLKKQKLRLKDKAYAMIMEYRKNNCKT